MSKLIDKAAWKKWYEHCVNIHKVTTIDTFEPVANKLKRIKKGKKDYNYFARYYFPHYCDCDCAEFHIEAANTIKNNRDIFAVLEWAREHAKSVHADIIIPMWLWIDKQLNGMILAAKNETDACSLLGDLQAEFQYNQRLIHDFGEQFKSGTWEEGDFVIKDNIRFVAIGRGQSPRGTRYRERRPNYCVIDDIDDDEIINNPNRVEKVVNWILGALYGALNIRGARMVMVGNRIDNNSILANIVGDTEPDKMKRKGIWHSKIMATVDGTFTGEPIWPQKFTSLQLQRKFEIMGYYIALREYFHICIKKGKLFRNEWIKWDKILPLRQYDEIIAYFDPSYKPKTTNDFKAWRIWGKTGHYLHLIESFVRQCTITTAIKWAYDYYESLPDRSLVKFYMEDVFLADQFYDDFEAEAKIRGYFLPIRPDKRKKPDKYARIEATTPYYERGIIIYNEKKKNDPDFKTGLDQLLGFQKGASIHDDAPDADEGAIYLLNSHGRINENPGTIGKRKKPKGYY